MTDQSCSTCRWWDKKEPGHTYADCHRMPPQSRLSVDIQREPFGEQYKVAITRFPHADWPNTHQDNFCGEWSAKT